MGGLIPELISSLLLTLAAGQDPAPWEVARALPGGLQRARAFAAVLADASGDSERLEAALGAAYECFREEERAYRVEAATTLAEAVHAAAGAGWSAHNLAGIARRAGDYPRADAVLEDELARASTRDERVDLLEARAIVAAGAGWRDQERALLGAALARGGEDACQMLGRIALAQGRLARARTLFRRLVERAWGTPQKEAAAPPWALRGWGLALLPAPPEPLGPPAGGAGSAPACYPRPAQD